jgi:hypothetical protein
VVAGDWWLVAGGWWLVAEKSGWWLVTGERGDRKNRQLRPRAVLQIRRSREAGLLVFLENSSGTPRAILVSHGNS